VIYVEFFDVACQKIIKISQCFTQLLKNKSGPNFLRHGVDSGCCGVKPRILEV